MQNRDQPFLKYLIKPPGLGGSVALHFTAPALSTQNAEVQQYVLFRIFTKLAVFGIVDKLLRPCPPTSPPLICRKTTTCADGIFHRNVC